jgi:hypothetical protein
MAAPNNIPPNVPGEGPNNVPQAENNIPQGPNNLPVAMPIQVNNPNNLPVAMPLPIPPTRAEITTAANQAMRVFRVLIRQANSMPHEGGKRRRSERKSRKSSKARKSRRSSKK